MKKNWKKFVASLKNNMISKLKRLRRAAKIQEERLKLSIYLKYSVEQLFETAFFEDNKLVIKPWELYIPLSTFKILTKDYVVTRVERKVCLFLRGSNFRCRIVENPCRILIYRRFKDV